MSHGSVEKCEPNMIPMLDLVLQLVMFFMLCANFIMEDSNAAVILPTALQARPLEKTEDYVITLNVDTKGDVLLGRDATAKRLTNAVQVRSHMQVMHAGDTARIERAKGQKGKAEPKLSLVVIRAHQDCTFKQVNDVVIAAKQAGYTNFQFRAIVGTSATK